MSERARGFTLIELMVTISILTLLAAVLLPSITRVSGEAHAFGDEANLRWQGQTLATYARQHGGLPLQGGARFVLAGWNGGACDHTPESFDRFWTPGPARNSDPRYRELRVKVLRGEDPWPALDQVSSLDTHYAGRATGALRCAERDGNEAWMADDNEFGWNLGDGTVNVLFCGGAVRGYSHAMLREVFGVGPFDANAAVVTWGPESPIPPCRQLDYR